jgi:hypothetical protein
MVSSSAPQGFSGGAGLGRRRDTSLIQLPQRTSLSQLRVSGSCVHQTDCVISAWCRDTSYESYCVTNGEHGHCPAPHCVMSASLTKEVTTATTATPSTSSPRDASAAPGQCDIEVKSGDYCFKFWEEGIGSLTCDGVIHCVRGNDATYGLQAGACCTSSSEPPTPTPATPETTPAPISAEPTPAPPSAEPTPAPPPVDSAGEGEWTWWPVDVGSSGITYHGPAYSIERYCSSGEPIGDMCWALAQDQHFTHNILPAFCARTDVKIAFGHPDVQKCGECSELRVKRRDGGYNYVTVMTTDHPETTNTSPELSDSGKMLLDQDTVNGITCPQGGGPDSADCTKDDRLIFEYRKVPCVP